jgi:AcrR family transcriptional regulator
MTAPAPTDFAEPDQRRRIVAALIDTVDRRGPLSLTVADIAKAAGVSRAAFYRHFDDVDDCFDSVCDEAFDVLFDPFLEAYSTLGPWAKRLNAALVALLDALSREPLLGEICLVHSPARQRDRRTYRRAIDCLAAVLREGRPVATSLLGPSPRGEEILAGGTIGLIAARLAGGGRDLEELASELVWLLAAPLELEPADWHVPAALN